MNQEKYKQYIMKDGNLWLTYLSVNTDLSDPVH
jgi:hypothetical protein